MLPWGLDRVSVTVYMLLSWPLIVRRFFAERQFADILAGDAAPLHQRAPDLGLTALGWLLLAMGSMAVAQAVPALFASNPMDQLMSRGGGGGMESLFTQLSSFAVPTLGRPAWWLVGLSGLQLWAGIELVRMSDRYRIVGTIYGAVSIAVALYVYMPVFKSLRGMFDSFGGGGGMGGAMVFISLAMSLTLPVGALILVNRRSMANATARVRAPDPAA